VLDGQTGVGSASGIIVLDLLPNAAITMTSAQIEAALHISLPATDRPRLTLSSASTLTVQSYLLQPGGAFNEVSGAQSGTSATLETYVPAAAAVTGYTSFVRVINTSATASTPITVALIDPVSGQAGNAATLVASLSPDAALTFSSAQVETALGTPIAASTRPRLLISGNGNNVIEVQSFLVQPGGVFTDVSGGQ
jgi:hypothetical protein